MVKGQVGRYLWKAAQRLSVEVTTDGDGFRQRRFVLFVKRTEEVGLQVLDHHGI